MTSKGTDNDYRIIVRNKQSADGETSVIEEMAYGTLYARGSKFYIIYKTENDGDSVSSLIKIDNDTVSIKRGGSINASIVYKSGEKRAFVYKTVYGGIEMETNTHRVYCDMDEDGGSVELVYTLVIQGEEYFNDMKITVVKR